MMMTLEAMDYKSNSFYWVCDTSLGAVSQEGPRDPPNYTSYDIAIGCPWELDAKTLMLNASHTFSNAGAEPEVSLQVDTIVLEAP